jgi:hypothetical protein
MFIDYFKHRSVNSITAETNLRWNCAGPICLSVLESDIKELKAGSNYEARFQYMNTGSRNDT